MEIKAKIRKKIREYPYFKRKLWKTYEATANIPFLGEYVLRWVWSKEMSLLDGIDISKSSEQSIIHLSVNRSATQFVKRILKKYARERNMVHINWNAMAASTKYPYMDQISKERMEKFNHIYRTKGYVYSPYGGYPKNIPNEDKFRILLIVRDPRDILVSKYYSTSYSHLPPIRSEDKKEFYRRREKAKKMDINEWVLEMIPKIEETYRDYRTNIDIDSENVHYTKFEKMISGFRKWIEKINKGLDLSLSKEEIDKLVNFYYSSKPSRENKYNRQRKGEKKDFVDKLNKKTIRKMNSRMEKTLDYFGYDRR